MGTCLILLKVFLVIFCIFLWAIAAGLLFGIGAYFISINDYSSLTEGSNLVYTLVPLIAIILVALVLIVLGIMGIIGAVIANKALLSIFSCVLVIVMIAQVAVGVLAVVFRGEAINHISIGLEVNFQRYNTSSAINVTVDFVQSNLQCCGVTNSSFWGDQLPDSCCPDNDCEDNSPYTIGCLTIIESRIVDYSAIFITIAILLALIETLGIVFACILMCFD